MSSINIKNIVASHVTFLLVLAVIPMIWYGDGLISSIGLDLQLMPGTFLENIFYGWQSKHSLGSVSNASGWVFPSATFFSIFALTGLADFVIVRSWYVLTLFLAGVSMYSYINYLLKNNFKCDSIVKKCERVDYRLCCAFVGSVGYMANPYVVMHYDNGHFLIPYAILPIQLLIMAKGLKSGSLYYAALLALTSIIVTTNLPIVFNNYIVITLFGFWYTIWIDSKKLAQKLKFVLVSILLIGLNLLWYFVPTLFLLLSGNEILAGSIEQESWVMYGRHSNFSETFRLLGIWGLYAGGYEYANFYLNNALGIIITFLLPIFAVLPFIFFSKKQLLYFPLLLIIFSLFMAVGGNASSPFNPIYIYLYENIPIFSIFRNGYKFVGFIAFSYVTLISVFLFWMISRSVTKKDRVIAKYYSYTVIVIFLISAYPLYRGNIFNDKNITHVPSYWSDAAIWLNGQKGQFRIVLFPDQYFESYKWGAHGSFLASVPYLSQDMIFNNPTKENNELIQALYYPLAEHSNPKTHRFGGDLSTDVFCNILPILNVRFIIQRNDIDTSLYEVSKPKETKRFLISQECIKYVVSFGEIDIYEFKPHILPRIYATDQSYNVLKLSDFGTYK